VARATPRQRAHPRALRLEPGSSADRGATEPNKLIGLLYLGALALTAGVLALGIGLLTA
jgi:hypothetical protein